MRRSGRALAPRPELARHTNFQRDAHMDASQVKSGIATLSDAELAKLATRASAAQKDFAAGAIADHMLLLIVLAIAVIIIIIVAVKV